MGDTIKPQIEEPENKSAAGGTPAQADDIFSLLNARLEELTNALNEKETEYRRYAQGHKDAKEMYLFSYYKGMANALFDIRYDIAAMSRQIAKLNQVRKW